MKIDHITRPQWSGFAENRLTRAARIKLAYERYMAGASELEVQAILGISPERAAEIGKIQIKQRVQ
jgi:hypothetical protein